MTKEKKIWLGLTMLVVLAIGGSFAWWMWTSTTNTNVSLTIDNMSITYDAGPNIETANLIPVSSKERGVTDGTAIEKTITVTAPTTMYLNLYMTLEVFPEELQHESFVYEIYKGSELVTSGNFGESAQSDRIQLLKREEVGTTESVYNLYIWIDGNQTNPTTMMNQNFKFVLSADGTTNPVEYPIMSTYLISKSDGDSWEANSSGLYKTTYTTEDGTEMAEDYRYVGAGVNNFVSFNNDLYRVIGVFDENTHGKAGEQLVKLIMENPLYAASYGVYNDALKDGVYSNYSNNWTGTGQTTPANANILLNQYYFSKTNTSDTYGLCSNWTYYYSSSANDYKIQDCSTLVGYGIDESLRDYIEITTWYLNGYTDNSLTKENFYLCERGLYTGCGPATNGDATTDAKIGLMYISDYMYATGFLGSSDTTIGSSPNYGNQNWLYKGDEWIITPMYNNANKAFYVRFDGSIYHNSSTIDNNSNSSYSQRPTFYLKSDVKITGGEGTFDNPYTIGM